MSRPRSEPLRRVVFSRRAAPDVERLAAEFPTVGFERADDASGVRARVDASAWASATSFAPFDAAVVGADDGTLAVLGDGATTAIVGEILTRYQRRLDRRNDASRTPAFDRALAAHDALHDRTKPLVVADLDHALDTWQWTLRLRPGASSAVQLAALFHDVERLTSEADARVEHRAPDYQAFKDAHARAGAERTVAVLRAAGVDGPTAARAGAIVAAHERRGDDDDVDLLNDADGLSFFSLNSSGYLDYFGAAQTCRKIRYTLGRLGPSARRRLGAIRLRPDVAALLREVAP